MQVGGEATSGCEDLPSWNPDSSDPSKTNKIHNNNSNKIRTTNNKSSANSTNNNKSNKDNSKNDNDNNSNNSNKSNDTKTGNSFPNPIKTDQQSGGGDAKNPILFPPSWTPFADAKQFQKQTMLIEHCPQCSFNSCPNQVLCPTSQRSPPSPIDHAVLCKIPAEPRPVSQYSPRAACSCGRGCFRIPRDQGPRQPWFFDEPDGGHWKCAGWQIEVRVEAPQRNLHRRDYYMPQLQDGDQTCGAWMLPSVECGKIR